MNSAMTGWPKELDDVGDHGALQRGDLADQRVGEDQYDRYQQRCKGHKRARQLFRRQQIRKVLGNKVFVLLILFVDAVEHAELRFAVLGAVDLIRDNQIGVFLAEVAEQRYRKGKQRD